MRVPVIAAILAALVGCASATPSSPSSPPSSSSASAKPGAQAGPALSVSSNPRSDVPPDLANSVADFNRNHNAGIHADFVAWTWSKLEPRNGALNVTDVGNYFQFARSRFSTVLVGIQTINTTGKETPADLTSLPFNAAAMKARFHALLDALQPYINDAANHVAYISMGNEVDVYLSQHPEAWPQFTDFYADAAAYSHKIAPLVRVGVTVTFAGISTGDPLSKLVAPSDVAIETYYPLDQRFHVRPPSDATADFAAMVASARGKPLVIQELGYPSAAALGSSEANQAEFLRVAFRAWAASHAAIPMVNVLSLHDLSPQQCQQFGQYYGQSSADFEAYLCSLGIRHGDDSAKPAWDVFAQQAEQLR